VTFSETMMHAV